MKKNNKMDEQKLEEDLDEIRMKLIMSSFAEHEGKKFMKENEELSKDPFYHPSVSAKRRFINRLRLRLPLFFVKKVLRFSYPKLIAVLFFLVVVVCATSLTVEAVRVKVLNLFIQVKNEYTDIRMGQTPQQSEDHNVPQKGNNVYIPTEIPDGFHLTATTEFTNMRILQYDRDGHENILFQSNNENTSMSVDTEDADEVTHMIIQGGSGLVIRKQDRISVVWKKNDQLLSIIGNTSDVSKEALIKMAESVQLQK
ncbi:hypothetical protein PA598K_07141 [Paenibacillus sp. 598K]|uniref:DUF4367 domain-containing protein n=1 Tax=Paenibacillus sp. 598K TaxID=1117987 RepID=UPI000FFA864F|nr:DUF4367 domain-containing protein [Paenibacillus sp. 598K]GBF78490.1 hypothetical protein PA598K_07141 [Paenibacillus sp. 598K]